MWTNEDVRKNEENLEKPNKIQKNEIKRRKTRKILIKNV